MNVSEPPVALPPVAVGDEVVGADGEKVGEVFAVYPEDARPTHLVVQAGFVFRTGYFVPLAAVAGVEGGRVVLAVAKDRVDEQGWGAVPD